MAELAEATQEMTAPMPHEPYVLHLAPVVQLDDDQLLEFCRLNKDLQIERDAEGNLIVMSPEGFNSASGAAALVEIFRAWAKRDGTGKICGPSGGFILPNKAMRAPDVSWVLKHRLAALSKKELQKFPHLCPDFVLELLSPSDSRRQARAKMEEYIANGATLGWLIDPARKQLHIYRPSRPSEVLDNPGIISGEPLLKGFSLNFSDLWAEMDLL